MGVSIILKGGRVIDPKNNIDKVLDVHIEGGKIKEVAENITVEGEIIDVSGKIVAPGLVDMHCHLREPGYEYKEDIESGTRSAAVGGFTSVACMPNTNPIIDNSSVVAYVLSRPASVNVFPIGAISKGQMGEMLADIGEMKQAGIVAVSDDGRTLANSALMRHGIEYATNFDLPVISHCEDVTLAGSDGAMNEGYMSTVLGLRGINRAGEEIIIARDVLIAVGGGTSVHIAHVTTVGGVEIIRQAKRRGVAVTCETCPHYFTLTDEAVEGFNTLAKVSPPLRTAEDVEAIKQGLADGTIDAIATDNAPHHVNDKACEFAVASFGMVGFETALALGITQLVDTGTLSMAQLVEKMSLAPSRILKIDRGTLSLGAAADVVVFDAEREYTVCVDKFASRAKNSPIDGYKLKGQVLYTIVGGKVIVRDGNIDLH